MCKHIYSMMTHLSKKVLEAIKQSFRIPVSDRRLSSNLYQLCSMLDLDDPEELLGNLLKDGVLHKFPVTPQRGRRKYYYSSRPELPLYEIAYSLWPNSYFCNLTAIFHHGLTNQVPRVSYIAKEGKGRSADEAKRKKKINLSDQQIFDSFIKPHRVTKNQFILPKGALVLTERVYREETGVVSVGKENKLLPEGARVTCLERALIDACINPQYNGGIASVVEYFREASGRIDGRKLVQIYRKLSFAYPYWQSIGFICDRTGIKRTADTIYRSFKATNKFYLDHNAKTSWKYDDKWHIHYPEIF